MSKAMNATEDYLHTTIAAEIAAVGNDVATRAALAQEARLTSSRNVLLVFGMECPDKELAERFFGVTVIASDGKVDEADFAGQTVYLCGDLSLAPNAPQLSTAAQVMIVGPLSTNSDALQDVAWPVVGKGRVPINVHGVGVLYREFFDFDDVFHRVQQEHTFQSLTESSKPGIAYRTGIYLTPVKPDEDGDLRFRLLRCSTNLSGPTDNFRATDHRIVDALNQEAATIFDNQAPLNHVLAQIYWNTEATDGHKMTKAKIKDHADKTKDMPRNGIMAFSTFYGHLEERLKQNSKTDPFDWVFKGKTSGLTLLRFRLKSQVNARGSALAEQFDVKLYPNSVFFMPLSTNRLYTHEICPSVLASEQLPTRLGYVVRCAATEAVHKEGQTFLLQNGGKRQKVAMKPPMAEGVQELRRLYREENISEDFIDYGGRFLFSMNKGDYLEPKYRIQDEFRTYQLHEVAPFPQLRASTSFETTGKGRLGAVLLQPDEERGTPIVRTTTQYNNPAQCFQQIHRQLAQQIQATASLPRPLNNALVEVYNNQYTKMGFHSDQAQDLASGSHIALFSAYQHPDLPATRKLVVESKLPTDGGAGGKFEIPLRHNSVVVWSLDTNRRFRHKIVLDRPRGCAEPEANEWLGFTFRTSKTFIQYRGGGGAFFGQDGSPLTLSRGEACRPFYKLRARENNEMDFVYPHLTSTISPSDLLPPVEYHHASETAEPTGAEETLAKEL